MKAAPKSTQDYLRTLADDRRLAFERLRAQILGVLPDAEPCISYSMPAFRVPGGVVAGFLATKRGCSYYPFSGRTLKTLAEILAGYSQTPGALHFDPTRGLPLSLVRKLLRTRLAELAPHAAEKKTAKHPAKTSRQAKPAKRPAKTSRQAKTTKRQAKTTRVRNAKGSAAG